MNRRSAHLLAIGMLGVVMLAACSSSGDDAAAPQEESTQTSQAATTSAPATTVPATTQPPTTAPSTTAPAVASATAQCVQGVWLLDDAATLSLHKVLLPAFPLVVNGSQQLTFEGDTVEYFINEVVQFVLADTDLSVAFDTRSAGTYELGSGAGTGEDIVMDYATVEGGFSPIQGSVQDSSGDAIAVFESVVGPDFSLPSIGGGPITCDGDTMTILVTSGLGSADAVFTRIG